MKFFNRPFRQRGQSILEFAVIVPGFLALMLLVIYGGMMISDYLALKHVAGTAARVATLTDTTAEISTANETVLKNNTALMVCKDLTLTPAKLTDGDFVCVTASATINVKFVKDYFGGSDGKLKATSAPEYKGS